MKKLALIACLALLLLTAAACGAQEAAPEPSITPSAAFSETPAAPSPSPSAEPTATPTASESAAPSPEASPSPAQTGSAADYFPILENVHYIYDGEGNEYAPYEVYIDFAKDNKVQQRINNGGSEVVKVIQADADKVTLNYKLGECYYRENFLDKTEGGGEVLLMAPIAVGTTWNLESGGVRTITAVDEAVSTPSGDYQAVVVQSKSDSGTTTDYYVKDVGLVKTVVKGEGYEVSSTLREIRQDDALTRTVRFYYPNINDDKLYYLDKQVAFKTNDITRLVLADAYKADVPNEVGKVFSENTVVNSLYLNKDGMVYIDLTKAFQTEMNAGASFEAMILQCVANTFGGYYGTDKVILTLDNSLYTSGHIEMKKGEYLAVDAADAVAISG